MFLIFLFFTALHFAFYTYKCILCKWPIISYLWRGTVLLGCTVAGFFIYLFIYLLRSNVLYKLMLKYCSIFNLQLVPLLGFHSFAIVLHSLAALGHFTPLACVCSRLLYFICFPGYIDVPVGGDVAFFMSESFHYLFKMHIHSWRKEIGVCPYHWIIHSTD